MDYYTPVKQNLSCAKPSKTAVKPREGDWICLNCNNLNFSFRKKCNRCKVQTKIQNQSSAAFYLDYYNQIYFCPANNQEGCRDITQTITTNHSTTHSHTPPKQRKNLDIQDKENRTPSAHKRDLPSVSPLIKKYKARQATPMSQARSDESIWGVTVRNFQQLLASSRRSDQNQWEASSQNEQRDEQDLERMIGSIML